MATAFHRNTMTNTEGGTDDEEFRVAAIKDRVDTTMQVWMGLTMGCAKCHSHKYDPITQEEYYKFYAFFNQTADDDQPDESAGHPRPDRRRSPSELGEIDAQIAELKEQLEAADAGAGRRPGQVGGEPGRPPTRRRAEGRAQGDPGDPRHAGRRSGPRSRPRH